MLQRSTWNGLGDGADRSDVEEDLSVPRGTVTRSTYHTTSELLEAGLEELGLRARAGQVEALTGLSELVERWGRSTNLSGHRSAEAVARHLVLPAAGLFSRLPAVGTVADLGSGAGFPALPVAILWPDRCVTSVEARERRHHFQRAAVRELGLENVHLQRGRAESIPASPHELVVAQAVGPPGQVVEWMLRWVAPGGLLVIPGGEVAPELAARPGLAPGPVLRYREPLGGPSRTAWIARR